MSQNTSDVKNFDTHQQIVEITAIINEIPHNESTPCPDPNSSSLIRPSSDLIAIPLNARNSTDLVKQGRSGEGGGA